MDLLQLLTVVLVPLVIAVAKVLVPKMPSWLLPILAPILGGAADALGASAGLWQSNPTLGAILGSAGVGLREIVDQLKKAVAGT